MRLTKEADYAVLALMYLGGNPPGEITGRPEIARRLGIPETFLAKVLGKLCRAGIIASFAGAKGGYRLTRDPADVDLASVIEAIDGPVVLVRCLDEPGPPGSLCATFCKCSALEGLRKAQARLTEVLRGVSLAEMMPPQSNLLHLAFRSESPEGLPSQGPGARSGVLMTVSR